MLLRTSRRGTPRLYSWQNRILIHPLQPGWINWLILSALCAVTVIETQHAMSLYLKNHISIVPTPLLVSVTLPQGAALCNIFIKPKV